MYKITLKSKDKANSTCRKCAKPSIKIFEDKIKNTFFGLCANCLIDYKDSKYPIEEKEISHAE